jgi:hypothetical protein
MIASTRCPAGRSSMPAASTQRRSVPRIRRTPSRVALSWEPRQGTSPGQASGKSLPPGTSARRSRRTSDRRRLPSIDRLELPLNVIPPGLVVGIVRIGHLRGDETVVGAQLAGQVRSEPAATLGLVHAPGALDEQDRLAVHGMSSTRWISVAFKDQHYRPTLQPSCRISSGAELATNIERRRSGCDYALRERSVAGEFLRVQVCCACGGHGPHVRGGR